MTNLAITLARNGVSPEDLRMLAGQAALLILMYGFFGSERPEAQPFLDLLVLLAAWTVSVLITLKHRPKFHQRYFTYISAPFLKAAVIMMGMVFFFKIILGLGPAQTRGLFVSAFLYAAAELVILAAWGMLLPAPKIDPDKVLAGLFASKKYTQADLPLDDAASSRQSLDLAGFLGKNRLAAELRQFLEAGLSDHGCPGAAVIRSPEDPELSGEHIGLIVSQVSLNNTKAMNSYLKECYRQLENGGWLVVKYSDINEALDQLKQAWGSFLAYPVWAFRVLVHGALPKIPGLKEPYLAITKGRHRLLSRVEAWGRLAYCGFDVIQEQACGPENYVLARKTKTPSDNPNPSWYPLITLDRVGLYGQIIKIHKIRTMYPYSEFLQKRLFEENKLSATGKFNQDYRVTRTGRIMRKYWLDELPQVIDWLRGEIKLVGIRAMSLHFFSLYPRNYQELFISVKPGILSPVFDEDTPDFNQIVDTESRYLRAYLEKPVQTDMAYFFKAFDEIFFQGTRSA